MATAIHDWLKNGGSFDEGLHLLKTHDPDPDPDLIWFLELGDNSISRGDLTDALRTLHDAALRRTLARPEKAMVETPEKQGRDAERRSSDGYQGVQLPEELQALHSKVKDWWKEYDYLRATILRLRTRKERADAAGLILERKRWIRSAYHRLDTWVSTGLDPGAERKEVDMNGAQMLQRYKNLQSYLSRVAKGNRKASPEKVKAWEEEMARLKEQLGC